MSEAKDKKRKAEIKNLVEQRKQRELEIEQQRVREEMGIPDPDEYKSHASDEDNATSGRSPSAM